MNERIKELAEQAGFRHPDHVGLSEEYAYFDHEKFAELLVKECAETINDGTNPSIFYQHQILRHFGVEE
jgi:hypothetical protein